MQAEKAIMKRGEKEEISIARMGDQDWKLSYNCELDAPSTGLKRLFKSSESFVYSKHSTQTSPSPNTSHFSPS